MKRGGRKDDGGFNVPLNTAMIITAAKRMIPARLAYLREDIVAQALAHAFEIWKTRGIRMTAATVRFQVYRGIESEARRSRRRYAVIGDFNFEGVADAGPRVPLDERAWCMHTLTQRWHTLTEKQQACVYNVLAGHHAINGHGGHWSTAIAKLSGASKSVAMRGAERRKVDYSAIRTAFARVRSQVKVAEMFGVSQAIVHHALREHDEKYNAKKREDGRMARARRSGMRQVAP